MSSIVGGLSQVIFGKFSLDRLLFHFSVNVQSHVVKKNARPIYRNKGSGKVFLGKSRKLVGAEEFLTLQLQSQANQQGIQEPIDEPVWVVAHFYYRQEDYFTKKGVRNKTLPDLGNLLELPCDVLEKSGIIANDNLIESFDLSRRLCGPETKLEIFLLKHDLSN